MRVRAFRWVLTFGSLDELPLSIIDGNNRPQFRGHHVEDDRRRRLDAIGISVMGGPQLRSAIFECAP